MSVWGWRLVVFRYWKYIIYGFFLGVGAISFLTFATPFLGEIGGKTAGLLKKVTGPSRGSESSGDSTSVGDYFSESQRYVLIEGKYYKHNPSNIYVVNGEKVFYQDNSQEWYAKKVEKGASGGLFGGSAKEGNDVQMMNLMGNIEQIQKKTKERNQALENLMNDKDVQ